MRNILKDIFKNKNNPKRIFMDYASTTPVDKKVIQKMNNFADKDFANPLALYKEGILVKNAILESREKVAKIAGVKKEEVIYTSGGTESNNLAILGFLKAYIKNIKSKQESEAELESELLNRKFKIITTSVEHSSILKTLENAKLEFQKNNLELEIIKLGLNKEGRIDIQDFKNALDQDVILISIMYANNEMGSIFPLREIGSLVKKYKNSVGIGFNQAPFIHTDASQAVNFLDINFDRLHIHMMTIDGSKIYGPKGAGILIKKSCVEIENILFGGGQESGIRPGTENVSNIIGISEAMYLAEKNRQDFSNELQKLQKYFFQKIEQELPSAKIMGDMKNRIPNNINICIPNINSEFVVIQLDEAGIACSPMTTCKNVSDIARSYVIDEIDSNCGGSSLRFSLGKGNTKSEIDRVIECLKRIV